MKQTASQFLPRSMNDIGSPIPEKDGSYAPIQKYLGVSFEGFQHSSQQLGSLSQDIKFVTPFWLLSQSISVLIMAIFIFRSFRLKSDHETLIAFSVFLMLSLIINAAVCGILSGAFPRYQNRLIWLAALVPLSLLVQKYQSKPRNDIKVFLHKLN